MTDEMLKKARYVAIKNNYKNLEFRKYLFSSHMIEITYFALYLLGEEIFKAPIVS